MMPFRFQKWGVFDDYTLSFDTSKHGVLLVDSNGAGKTTLLKGVELILSSSLPYQSSATSLIQSKSQYAKVSTYEGETDAFVIYAINPHTGRFRKSIKKHNFPIIVFSYYSQYNYWLSFERSKKLTLLDMFLGTALLQSEYGAHLSKLQRMLKSKQKLIQKYHILYKECIKQKKIFSHNFFSEDDLRILDQLNTHIFTISKCIWFARDTYFGYILSHIHGFQDCIETTIDSIKLRRYSSDFLGNRNPFFDTAGDIDLFQLRQLFMRECISNRNLFGAHRDDFLFEINEQNAVSFLSTGEMRLFVLYIIKCIIQVYKIQHSDGKKVWWVLDDVCNELDSKREVLLHNHILSVADFWFITGTRIPAFYKKNTKYIELKKIKM